MIRIHSWGWVKRRMGQINMVTLMYVNSCFWPVYGMYRTMYIMYRTMHGMYRIMYSMHRTMYGMYRTMYCMYKRSLGMYGNRGMYRAWWMQTLNQLARCMETMNFRWVGKAVDNRLVGMMGRCWRMEYMMGWSGWVMRKAMMERSWWSKMFNLENKKIYFLYFKM